MTNSKLNTDGILLLEQPFVRVRLISVQSVLLYTDRPFSIRLGIRSPMKITAGYSVRPRGTSRKTLGRSRMRLLISSTEPELGR
jgi:hypothetical protein